MKTLFSLILLLALAASTLASVSLGNYSNPDYPSKCLIKPDILLSPGEYQYPAPDCGRILCSSNGMATFHLCGAQWITVPGCTLSGYADRNLNYPECCKRELLCLHNPDLNWKVVEF